MWANWRLVRRQTSDVRGVTGVRLLLSSKRSSLSGSSSIESGSAVRRQYRRTRGRTGERKLGRKQLQSLCCPTCNCYKQRLRFWRQATVLAWRTCRCGGGAPGEGITLARSTVRKVRWTHAWEGGKGGQRQVSGRGDKWDLVTLWSSPAFAPVTEDIKVQAGHADFSGRWSERRVAAVEEGGRKKKKQKKTQKKQTLLCRSVSPSKRAPGQRREEPPCPGENRASPDR